MANRPIPGPSTPDRDDRLGASSPRFDQELVDLDDSAGFARLLITRTQMVLWTALGAGIVFTLLDLIARPPRVGPFYVKCVGLTLIGTGLAALHGEWALRWPRVVSFGVVLVAYGLTALSGMLSPTREYLTTAFLFVGAALTTAILMPWGWRAQAVTVFAAAALLGTAVVFAGGDLWAFTGDPSAAVVVVFALSVVIAREIERYRVALGRELTGRRRAEREVRELNADLERRVVERTAELHVANSQLRALSARVEAVREEERTRIAREIHDDLGQGLTALKIELDVLPSRVGDAGQPLPSWVPKRLHAMSSLADEMMRSVRRIATDLRPALLDDLGLPAAIEWQAREFEARAGVRCTVTCEPPTLQLDAAHSTAMFRIVQEALTNVARHADAANVRIFLRGSASGAVLHISDDGRGVSEAQIENPASLGLVGIRERAQMLGGDVEFRGQPGRGTTVIVRLPANN
jgi:signal transduction histidine kinase